MTATFDRQKLRELRVASGYTQTRLAHRLGENVNAQEISGYENGRREPGVSRLWLLAHALGVRMDDLMKVEGGQR